ncbi:MAG TPA: hypothetical protein VMN77_05255 [Nitrospiria bacterium]|nr:hypothetical protein [Nitrospiria bacterium]
MMKTIYLSAAMTLFGAILLSSCASTQVTAAWRDDAYTQTPQKALVLLVTGKPTLLRVFEDEFSRQLKTRGIEAVPGYSLLPLDRKLDKEEIAAAAEKIHADTVLITRLVDKKSYETYYPGSVYATHPGAYNPGWNDYYSRGFDYYQATPGYTVQRDILYVETQLYDVSNQHLIWSVMTETLVGDPMETEVRSFVKIIMKNLSQNRLVEKQ